jgi:hypothetical protein
MKKLAYLILVHSDAQQFGKLISSLGENCDIYVHVDKKADISPFLKIAGGKNVIFAKSRVSISWAGISMIDAQNILLIDALNNKERYSHLIFLSGSCYPIKNQKEIYETITKYPQREFIKFIDMRDSPGHYMKQIKRKWFNEPLLSENWPLSHNPEKILRKIATKFNFINRWNDAVIPCFGSQWCALTVDCCQHIIDYQRNNPWYREMNRLTFSPDEHYYHTIVGNSPYADMSDGVQHFEGRGTWRLANFHIIDETLAKWFTIRDWDQIATSDKLFVRKVRTLDGTELVARINQEILS